jgi:hypothetical protein
MEMTATELIEKLEEIADRNPDAVVRIATQPNWPLQFKVADVISDADFGDDESALDEWQSAHDECTEVDFASNVCRSCGDSFAEYAPDHDTRGSECDDREVVYLVEGGHPYDDSPYAPRAVFDAIGVR